MLLLRGALMPFVIADDRSCAGFMTLALHRRGQFERAALRRRSTRTLLIGLVLTIVDPQIVDFGLAVALLAPVQASLLARSPHQEARLGAAARGASPSAASAALGLVAWPEPARAEYALIAALCFRHHRADGRATRRAASTRPSPSMSAAR